MYGAADFHGIFQHSQGSETHVHVHTWMPLRVRTYVCMAVCIQGEVFINKTCEGTSVWSTWLVKNMGIIGRCDRVKIPRHNDVSIPLLRKNPLGLVSEIMRGMLCCYPFVRGRESGCKHVAFEDVLRSDFRGSVFFRR